MAVNSYKDDEKLTEKSKAVTLKRLFSYLLAYKWQILLVLVLMFYGVAISLLNPIMIESAIDRYIGNNNIPGLFRLMGIALILNLFVVLAMKIRMYIMAKVCKNILLTIRQQKQGVPGTDAEQVADSLGNDDLPLVPHLDRGDEFILWHIHDDLS